MRKIKGGGFFKLAHYRVENRRKWKLRGLGLGRGGGGNGLRPSRAAAWISNLDACEGSIIQFVWDFEYVGFES